MTEEQYDEAETFWIRKDKESRAMSQEDIRKWADDFLSSHKILALATGAGDYVRCTPLEYAWYDGALWIFTEGGMKFRALRKNRNVSAAVFEADGGFGRLKSMQIEGTADMVEPFSDEYTRAAEARKIPVEALKKLSEPMWLLKIAPTEITCLDSDFRKQGFGSRQIWKSDQKIRDNE